MLKKMKKRSLQRKEITVEQARYLSQERDLKGELANFDPLNMPIIKNGPDYELFQEYLEALERNGVRPETMDDRGRFILPSPHPIYGPRIAQMRNGGLEDAKQYALAAMRPALAAMRANKESVNGANKTLIANKELIRTRREYGDANIGGMPTIVVYGGYASETPVESTRRRTSFLSKLKSFKKKK